MRRTLPRLPLSTARKKLRIDVHGLPYRVRPWWIASHNWIRSVWLMKSSVGDEPPPLPLALPFGLPFALPFGLPPRLGVRGRCLPAGIPNQGGAERAHRPPAEMSKNLEFRW